MSAAEVSKLLAGAEACRGLNDEELETIAAAGEIKVGWDGAELMKEGERGDSMIMLIDGRVQVLKTDESGRSRELASVGPGTVLGEIALLDVVPRTATVKAATPVRYFQIERGAFARLLNENDRAANRMLLALARTLARRQRAANEKVVKLLAEAAAKGVQISAAELERFEETLIIEWE
jgi:CRP-like cAMP-binding protein